jgi:WD40 repeat protein
LEHSGWQERFSLKGHNDELSGLSFSPDGKRAATFASGESVALIFGMERGEKIGELVGHKDRVICLNF